MNLNIFSILAARMINDAEEIKKITETLMFNKSATLIISVKCDKGKL